MPYRLGSILIDENLCTQDAIEKAMNYQKVTGFLLGECLLHLNLCSVETINYAVHKQIEIKSRQTKKGFDLKELKSFFKIVLSYKKLCAAFVFFSLFSALFSANIVLPLTIGFIIDNVIPAGDMNQVLFFCLAGLTGLLIGNLTGFFMSNSITLLIANILKKVQEMLFEQLTKIPFMTFQKFKKGDLISRFSDNTEHLAYQLGMILPMLLQSTILFIIVFVMLLKFNSFLTLISILILFLCNFVPSVISDRSNSYILEEPKALGRISAFLKEGFGAFRYIKTNNKIADYTKVMDSKMTGYYTNNYQKWKYWTLSFSFKVVLNTLVLAIVLWFSGIQVIHNKMKFGELVVYFLLISQFIPNAQVFYEIYFRLQFLRKTWIRFTEIFAFPALDRNLEDRDKTAFVEPVNRIKIENVSFKYSIKQEEVLKNTNLTISQNNVYGIIGKSGSGKSTLVNLVMGLYNPTHGSIFYNNTPHDKIDVYHLWTNIGYLSQEPVIFDNMSIAENISIGASSIRDVQREDVIHAARKANIDGFIMSLPKGYETVVGVDEISLSGGEKQRIALARIFLRNPSIYIFDEPTSALDQQNGEIIMESIFREQDNKIILIISHDLALLKKCRKLIHFDKHHVELIEDDDEKINDILDHFKKVNG